MNSEDLAYTLDEILSEPDFLMQVSLDSPLPDYTCNPSSSLMVTDQITSTNCHSDIFLDVSSCDQTPNRPLPPPPPVLARPQPQPGHDIIKFEHDPPKMSKNKHVLTSSASTQEQSSKRYKHNVSQKKRRGRVKEKMETLKDLIPNCDKKGMASILDEAIKYIQLLKFQAQYYSGNEQQQWLVAQQAAWGGTQMPMISPATTSSMRAPSDLQYPPMVVMHPTYFTPANSNDLK